MNDREQLQLQTHETRETIAERRPRMSRHRCAHGLEVLVVDGQRQHLAAYLSGTPVLTECCE